MDRKSADVTPIRAIWVDNSPLNSQLTMKRYTQKHRRVSLLVSKVICQISRSHRLKKCRFDPDLSDSGRQLSFDFMDGNEMLHRGARGIEK